MSLKQPVQYPVKHYSHSDAGAPQLADADGVIKNLLKACLVTGYGTKEGAGWTTLFEDANRIVLRRPMGTGNPPDIKIENGTTGHRVVSQDNPTGLDDANVLTSTPIITKDSRHGSVWHLVVSDFGFVLCYQMGNNTFNGDRNNIIYCGSVKKIQQSNLDIFIATDNTGGASNGYSNPGFYAPTFLDERFVVRNIRTNEVSGAKHYLSLNINETDTDSNYLMQPFILLSKAIAPFYCSVSNQAPTGSASVIDIDNRPVLRYVNKMLSSTINRVFYIPLDYWEL